MSNPSHPAGNEGQLPPDEVQPGSLHCKRCGCYAAWGEPGGPNRSVSPEFVRSWWEAREAAATRARLLGHVLCRRCEAQAAAAPRPPGG